MIVEIAAVVTAVATSATVVFQYKRAMKNTVLPISARADPKEGGIFHVRLKVLPRHPIATISGIEGIGCKLQPIRYEPDDAGGRYAVAPDGHFSASLPDFNRTLLPGDEPFWMEFWARPDSSDNIDNSKICLLTTDSWLAKRHVVKIQTRMSTE